MKGGWLTSWRGLEIHVASFGHFLNRQSAKHCLERMRRNILKSGLIISERDHTIHLCISHHQRISLMRASAKELSQISRRRQSH